jgi:hypothetical protein
MRSVLDRARRRYAIQVRLQQRYSDRNDRSGGDALAASRWLRWQGPVLVGDLVPPA